jgi:hypothetical protein
MTDASLGLDFTNLLCMHEVPNNFSGYADYGSEVVE